MTERFSTEILTARLIASGVPDSLHGGLILYIQEGVPTGGFLAAVLRGDLFDACARADLDNQPLLHRIVFFLVNYAPAGCFGTPGAVTEWRAHRGLAGIEARA